jgi:hypothetical protein
MTPAYERYAQRLLQHLPKPAPFCKLMNGKLQTGTQSLHRTTAARMWRTFWRMKI